MKKLLLFIITFSPFVSYSQIINLSYCDTINFENIEDHIFIDTAQGNIWQIGNPNKPVFTSALSGSNCIVTDTVNAYPNSNKSSFIVKWGEATDSCSDFNNCYFLFFVHSMNANYPSSGYIEFSSDSVNWYNVFDDAGMYYPGYIRKVNNFNFPPTQYIEYNPYLVFNEGHGFTSNVVADTFLIVAEYVPYKSWINLMLRFTFMSDSIETTADGWMIDDIVIGVYTMEGGSVSENLTKSITLFPNPAIDKLAIDVDEKTFKPTTYRITNITGQELSNGKLTSRFVDVSTFPQGSYFITLTDDKGNSGVKMFYKQ